MSRSRQRAHEPQSIPGFEFCKIPCAQRDCKVRSLCLRIKLVLVGFGRVKLATPPGLDQRSFLSRKSRREMRRTSSFGTFGRFVERELCTSQSKPQCPPPPPLSPHPETYGALVGLYHHIGSSLRPQYVRDSRVFFFAFVLRNVGHW